MVNKEKELLTMMEKFNITEFKWHKFNFIGNGTLYNNSSFDDGYRLCKVIFKDGSYLSRNMLDRLTKKKLFSLVKIYDEVDHKRYVYTLDKENDR